MRELFCTDPCGSNLAQPLVSAPCFLCPGIPEDDTPVEPLPVPAAFAFTSGSSGGDIGFSKGVYGNVENQPLADFELLEIASRANNNFQVAFDGDCTEILAGYKPVIAGLTLSNDPPVWTVVNGDTTGNFQATNALSEDQEYNVTWIKV